MYEKGFSKQRIITMHKEKETIKRVETEVCVANALNYGTKKRKKRTY